MITTSQTDGVATVLIDRADKANALRVVDKRAVAEALAALASDDGIRAVVVTGGSRAFCAGSDLSEMSRFGPREMYDMLAAERAMYSSVLDCAKPVVAAVNGHAMGAGLILAMCCDYAVAAEPARFATPELTIG